MKRLFFVIIIFFIGGCAVIPPPTVKPFSDNREWVLVEDLEYSIRNSSVKISVPRGFVTDFASIPRPLWSILSPHGKYSRAAIIHDYLYWKQECTREQADNILLIAMEESGVCNAQRKEIYAGVRVGGKSAWESNKKEKEAGLPRIIPANRLNFPADINWADYRKILFNEGVRDTSSSIVPAYCSFGN
jgi:hypothetical protein